jgi:hypothetical protein
VIRRVYGPARLRAAITPAVLLAWTVTVAFLALVAAAAAALDREVAFFTREPVAALQTDRCVDVSCSYVGIVSNVGVLVWTAGATLAIFAGVLSPRRSPSRRLLLAAGALTLVLLLDDQLLLHENVWREVVPKGETGVFAIYFGLIVLFAVAFRRELADLRTTALAVIALGLFAAAAAADRWGADLHLIEDGVKLLAIVTWTAFLAATARDLLRAPAGAHSAAR